LVPYIYLFIYLQCILFIICFNPLGILFRETKESELRNLLKTRRDLESKLSRVGLEDSADPTSRLHASLSKSMLSYLI
jgi:hypothetical protein